MPRSQRKTRNSTSFHSATDSYVGKTGENNIDDRNVTKWKKAKLKNDVNVINTDIINNYRR